jgi:hypothetical protein
MEFLLHLSQQPLFQLIGAIIVLLLAEQQRPVYAIAAFVIWATWIWAGTRQFSRPK